MTSKQADNLAWIGWGTAGFSVLAGLGWLVWVGQFAASEHLFGMPSAADEAAYCLAVAERISEITRGQGDPVLEAHLDEQVALWRSHVGDRSGAGRAALGRDTQSSEVNEQAHLHLAVQDCAHRAVAFYGHRFAGFD
jgi:hypothetical protein